MQGDTTCNRGEMERNETDQIREVRTGRHTIILPAQKTKINVVHRNPLAIVHERGQSLCVWQFRLFTTSGAAFGQRIQQLHHAPSPSQHEYQTPARPSGRPNQRNTSYVCP